MTLRYCRNCRTWHEKKGYGECPACGDTANFNKYLRTAQLNNHLFTAIEQQQSERAFVKKAREEERSVLRRFG